MEQKRIVVKVGTNVLTNKDNRIIIPVMEELVRQIAVLYERGILVALVSSGSIISGKEVLSEKITGDKAMRLKIYSAVGQPRLMRHYYNIFQKYGMRCAQMLPTKHDFTEGIRRQNLVDCYESILSNGIIPITNEDDVTSLWKSMFSDNDELASNVADLIRADQMILLSDTDGFYNGNPKDAHAERLSTVRVDQDVECFVQASTKKEGEGRGGMLTKLRVAKLTAAKGIPTVIAMGKTKNIIIDIIDGKDIGTKFIV